MGSKGYSVEGTVASIKLQRTKERSRERAAWLTFLAFYVVIANIPYWIVSREFGFSNLGLFCVEYLLVGLLALVLPRYVSSALLLAVIFADLLYGVSASYYLPIRESLRNVCAARALSRTRFLCAAAAVLLMVLLAFASAYLAGNFVSKSQRRHTAIFLVAFVIFIVAADILRTRFATGYLPQTLRSAATFDGVDLRVSQLPRLARIPIIRLVHLEAYYASTQAMVTMGAASNFPVPSATGTAMEAAGITPETSIKGQPNLVLVVLESWGLVQDSPLKRALVQPYAQADLLAKYEVLQGTVPFYGPTIAGEARELCGSGIGFYLLAAPASDLKSCIPQRLAAMGYQNIALHGMIGNMFNRSVWYGRIGFQEIWFNDRFKRHGLPDCAGALVGTCDADIAAWIGQRLDQDNTHPYFIHWMTLNSHLPVPVPTPLSNGNPCVASLSLTPNSPLCSWYQLVENVHQSVAQVAMSNLARPTVFVIVGDHAPPFANPALRSQFSQTDVPYVVLVPRGHDIYPKSLLARSTASSLPGTAKPSRQMP